MSKLLIKYVRDRKTPKIDKDGKKISGNPIGVITAFVENDNIHYGWSLLNRKENDRWDRDTGINLALSRSVPLDKIALKALSHEIPQSVSRELANMVYRAKSYFHQV